MVYCKNRLYWKVGLEFIIPDEDALELWDQSIELGVAPIGLGARDTLRLELG